MQLPIVAGILCSQPVAVAQLIPDHTLGTEGSTVVPSPDIRGTDGDRIEGGAIRGTQLFHSFEEFNVGAGRGVYFSNPAGIANILTRVTGGNPSRIEGTLGVLGAANLFLINPQGLVFGPGARLDLRGSFVGSTARSVLFEEFAFDTVEAAAPPLLTIGVPIGLQVGENPGGIDIRSQQLLEPTGSAATSLSWIGGEVRLTGGQILAPGADVQLGGLAAGVVALDADRRATFPAAGADVSFDDGARVDVRGDGGGSVAVTARNLSVLGGSQILAGIAAGSLGDNTAGDIAIAVTEGVLLQDSTIANDVQGVGNGGAIDIFSGTLTLLEGARLSASTAGIGNTGSIQIRTTGTVDLQGESQEFDRRSAIASQVLEGADGSAGAIDIEAASLTLRDGAFISTSTLGTGAAGAIRIRTAGAIELRGEASRRDVTSDLSFPGSSIISRVREEATGDSLGISIESGSLFLGDGALVDASTLGEGSAGAIRIHTTGPITLQGESGPTASNPMSAPSGIISRVLVGADGNAGSIAIEADGSLTLRAGTLVSVETQAAGQPGDIILATPALAIGRGASLSATIAKTSTTLSGGGSIDLRVSTLNLAGELFAGTAGVAPAGNIAIRPYRGNPNLDIRFAISTGAISTQTTSDGEGGDIAIVAPQTLDVRGRGRITAATSSAGNAGEIVLQAATLNVSNGTQIAASSEATEDTAVAGSAGNIDIRVDGSFVLRNESRIEANTASGRGNVAIGADRLRLETGSSINTNALGTATGGNIAIETTFLIGSPQQNSDITSVSERGAGGRITVQAVGIFGFTARTPEELETLLGSSGSIDPGRLPSNDITAFSAAGLSLDVRPDPTQGILLPPPQPLNAGDLILQGCSAGDGTAIGRFVLTGRGGLSTTPLEPLSSDRPLADTRLPRRWSQTPSSEKSEERATQPPQAIVETRGWTVDRAGNVVLVAEVPLGQLGCGLE